MKRQFALAGVAILALAACGETGEAPEETVVEAPAEEPAAPEATAPEMDMDAMRAALMAAVASDARAEGASVRDEFRNPAETLMFFGVKPSDTVVEIWPGGGWYTDIISVYLASGGGKLYGAHFDPTSDSERVQSALRRFDEKYVDNPDVHGDVTRTVLSQNNVDIAPAGSADVVVTFRNAHNFEMGGWAPDAFAAFYAALKPGGTLGVVDHRLPEDADKAREKSSGYIKLSTVRAAAEEAGFVFDGSSEVNANADDDTDHPFGVWTLPPISRTTDRAGNAPEGFDAEAFKAIGESDRMTLRFKKPVEPAEALLE
ncbi:MAG: hypothetical protein AAF830_14390 [Pseudomonadota bacterium]